MRSLKRIFLRSLKLQETGRGPSSLAAAIGIGLSFAVLCTLLRWSAVPLTADRAPFSFVYVAVAGATVVAGWRSGLCALVVGQLSATFLFLRPGWSLDVAGTNIGWALAFSTLAQLSLLAILGFYQAEIRKAWAARGRADKGRVLLIRELNHRVKNTLAVVQSIASNTFRRTDGASLHAFESRLMALARAHDLLMRQHWSASDMEEIIVLGVAPFESAETARFTIGGPPIRVDPQESVTLVLAMNELATNAAKYGALSHGEGRVAIGWNIAPDGGFELVWREMGGPPVTTPGKAGFGTRLVEAILAKQFDARVVLDFAMDGLVCSIRGKVRNQAAATVD